MRLITHNVLSLLPHPESLPRNKDLLFSPSFFLEHENVHPAPMDWSPHPKSDLPILNPDKTHNSVPSILQSALFLPFRAPSTPSLKLLIKTAVSGCSLLCKHCWRFFSSARVFNTSHPGLKLCTLAKRESYSHGGPEQPQDGLQLKKLPREDTVAPRALVSAFNALEKQHYHLKAKKVSLKALSRELK